MTWESRGGLRSISVACTGRATTRVAPTNGKLSQRTGEVGCPFLEKRVSAGMRGTGPDAHSNSVGAPLVGALFGPNQLRPGRPPGHDVGVTGWPPVDLGCLHREGNHKGCPYHREAIPPDGGSRLSLSSASVTMREIMTMNLKELFILRMGLDVEEGKEIVVAIDDGASLDCTGTGLRESATSWAGVHYPEQVKRNICKVRVPGSRRARELRRHAESGGRGVGYRPPAQARMPVPNELTMIQSFSDEDTKELFESENNRRFANISRVALRKLIQMNQARALRYLAIPPGNRLEALKGRLPGFHSTRVDNRWRIVFGWTDAGSE